MNQHDFVEITSELHHVTGGGQRAKAVGQAIKKAYQVGRPILKESADVAKDVGVLGGVAYGAKKAWDAITGSGQPQPAQPKE